MKESHSKYFLAIIPPEPIYGQIHGFKEFIRDHFNSKSALRSPPHITLHMPFEWPDKKTERLIDSLSGFTELQPTVNVVLKNFGCFEPRVIFVGVENSSELIQLQKDCDRFFKTKLNVFHAAYRDLPFHPHLTIAFRDLKKSIFPEAWSVFKEKNFEGSFTTDSLVLLKHDEKKWIVNHIFKLGMN